MKKTLSAKQKKTLWNELKLALQLADRRKESAGFIDMVSYYQAKKYQLPLIEGMSWKAYVTNLKFSERTLRRYLGVAEMIELWVEERYPEAEYITLTHIDDYVEERHRNGYANDIKTILRERQESKRLLAHLNGEITMKPKEFSSAMSTASKPVTEITAEPTPKTIPESEPHLFSLHDTITSAGYTYKPDGKYYNSEDNELSEEEYSEFVSETLGLQIFDETEKLLDELLVDVDTKVEQLRPDFLAYAKAHRSPSTRQLIEEKYKRIEQKAAAILHKCSTMLKAEE